MQQLSLLAVSCIAFGALTINACRFYDDTSAWDDDGWCEDHTSSGAGYQPGPGQQGDNCLFDDDCGDDLSCNQDVGFCVPSQPQACTVDEQCGPACYCDDATNLCAPSGLCSDDAQCDDGFACDLGYGTCVPEPPPPTCAEVQNEQECSVRADCEPVYAGVNCSCGPDCTCIGGEPGCVCESFEFFKCEDAPAAEQ